MDALETIVSGVCLDKNFGFGMPAGDSVIIVGMEYAIISFVFWIYVSIKEKHVFNPVSKKNMPFIGGTMCDNVAIVLYANAMAEDSVATDPILAVYPVITIMLSRIFLKEKLSLQQYLSLALLLAGTVLDMQHEMSRLLEKEDILKVETGSGNKKRTMSITDYSALVARSTSREVGNTARINQMVLNGFDLVEIPPHYPTCEVCAILQNRVYSISGKDKRFPPLSRAIGIYKNIHPNCRHVIVGWAEEAYTPQEIEEAIRRSNRSWEDPRTGEEIQLYNSIQRKLRLSRDMRAQYDRYKKRLGDDSPKSFYSFKRLKNAGGDRWKELQKKYRDKGIVDNAISCGIIKTDKQFGKKIGKHAGDFGLNASIESDQEKMNTIIDDIFSNNDEIRIGKWSGQHSDVIFYIKGENVVITKQNGEFITILKGDISSGRIADARRVKI